jgi:hypothetical protein
LVVVEDAVRCDATGFEARDKFAEQAGFARAEEAGDDEERKHRKLSDAG